MTATSSIRVVDLNDAAGSVIEPDWLAKAEGVHRQLRPHLPHDYAGKMRRVFVDGARMCVAIRDGDVVGGDIPERQPLPCAQHP